MFVTRNSDIDGEIIGWKSNKGLFKTDDGCWVSKCPIEENKVIDLLDCVTPTAFKALFGFTPRKGSIRQMELTLTEIL